MFNSGFRSGGGNGWRVLLRALISYQVKSFLIKHEVMPPLAFIPPHVHLHAPPPLTSCDISALIATQLLQRASCVTHHTRHSMGQAVARQSSTLQEQAGPETPAGRSPSVYFAQQTAKETVTPKLCLGHEQAIPCPVSFMLNCRRSSSGSDE